MTETLTIRPVRTRADRRAFVDLPWDIYRDDPYWVPPLKSEVHALIDPGKNPWFEHGRLQLFLAERDGKTVGRISAQIDDLVLERMPETGLWGLFEAKDAEAAAALIAAAERWLREEGMTQAIGPISISIWDEPGLLIEGFEEKPLVMMGHHRPEYQGWVEQAGYRKARDLHTFALDIRINMIPVIDRLIRAGERNEKLVIRDVDKSRFDEEAAIILDILNDAWSDNWGFVPLTESEIAYAGKKLKPIIVEDLVKIAEYDGKPAAFMITIPDTNELIEDLDGRLFPFGWAKLLWRLRRPRTRRARVPLMGVRKEYQKGRLASQFAFMLIEHSRRVCVDKYGIFHGEFGWVLEDNQGMMSIANLPGANINHNYRIYRKSLN
ncbi:N-acetyltransferase [Sphingomicrobium lutaoense]|uniref:GNAT superfamily N-acetyltransferase n=1 Tax=Sphingomicrobium lutaoense TaxID=515949 RepID=A0A839Z0B1_9SPHN|nr:N-acetyltransferase [Sphingomicrobium lutaoense]MBB3763122.1 GNAT superfamily N-acetyltransferase [Sphingomicrobium lutaoense]